MTELMPATSPITGSPLGSTVELDIKISDIIISADRSRSLDQGWVEVLAGMISAPNGRLINRITVRAHGDQFELVSGLHRLSAFVFLGRETIPARVSAAQTDEAAKFEEIVENIGRKELDALDRAHHLYDLMQVYERLHPEIKRGGDQKSAAAKDRTAIFAIRSEIAERVGLSDRAIRLAVGIWKGMSVATRKRCAGTWLADHQSSLQQLSQATAAIQGRVLDILLADKPKATSVADALLIISDGRLLTHAEKKFASINRSLEKLQDSELDAVLAVHEQRVMDWLKRSGRI